MNRLLLNTALWAFAVSLALAPVFIAIFRRLRLGQTIREEGPSRHLKKAGTPTMGGIVFLAAALPVALLFAPHGTELFLVVLLTVGNGFIGFVDDYLKVVRQRSLGLKARSKLLGQSALVTVFFLVWRGLGHSTAVTVPFTSLEWDLGLFYLPFLIFFVMGFTNAVNLTDGIDGLAAGSAILAFLAYLLVAATQGLFALAHFNAALIGAIFAFLAFNIHPAKVFMGDVGSLALGGALAAVAVLTKTELFLVVIGGVFVLETVSVIVQVIIFQLTGKRVFRMSPLHHHFELSGRGEWQVVTGFWAAGFMLALVGLMQLGAF